MLFIVPFVKHASYLKETLQSLIAQKDSNWEAIVLDNSVSPDETQACHQIVNALNDLRIQYSRNEKHLSMAENWNHGLDLAEGRQALVTILHSDDRLLPDYVGEIKALALKYPDASGYFCRCEIIDAFGSKTFSLPDWYKERIIPKTPEIVLTGINGLAPLLRGNFIFCPSICYHLPNLKKERFKAEYRMVMDFEFTARLLLGGGGWVGYYHSPLYQYRRHGEAQTSKLSQNLVRFEEEMGFYKKLETDLRQRGHVMLAKQAGQFWNVKLNLCSQVLLSALRLNWKLTIKQIRLLKRMC